ncbi:DNA repair protein RecO [Pedomonas sp. V897]|uniref:DNA repair protein RecO n=1 Tax=Pedomonas sp. V897 TaxID=3446482 RepID=UPI003EE30650
MHWSGSAIILSMTAHGESGAIVRVLTSDAGLIAGYVRGGSGRRLRPVLVPGNRVKAEWRTRVESQLGHMTVELDHSAAPIVWGPRLGTAILDWATALTAAALPERQPYPTIHEALSGLLTVMEASAEPRAWAATLVRYELILLSELGFGLDLTHCVATGATEDLAFVSPKSSQAVCREAGLPYAARLLPLPAFLLPGGLPAGQWPAWSAIADGLKLTGHFLDRDILVGRVQSLWEARHRIESIVYREHNENNSSRPSGNPL